MRFNKRDDTMQITHVEVKIPDLGEAADERLLAYASIVIGGWMVVKDIKIIRNPESREVFLAMPSRRRTDHCPGCFEKNSWEARYCNGCGRMLPPIALPERDENGRRIRPYADIVHPIKSEGRQYLHQIVLEAYYQKLREQRSQPESGSPSTEL